MSLSIALALEHLILKYATRDALNFFRNSVKYFNIPKVSIFYLLLEESEVMVRI